MMKQFIGEAASVFGQEKERQRQTEQDFAETWKVGNIHTVGDAQYLVTPRGWVNVRKKTRMKKKYRRARQREAMAAARRGSEG